LKRIRFALALLVLGAAGVAAPFAIPAIGAGSSTSKTVTIKVTASEWKFVLSKKSIPTGTTVIFKVTNKGKIGHDFKINGKKTPLIQPGKTATLKVAFKKKGRLTFICTVKGHAALGMKGSFAVGVKPVTTTTGGTTTGGTTTGTTTTTPTSCTNPTTTVTVGMREYAFDLSQGGPGQPAIPHGCVQFNIRDNGSETHNFDIQGVKAGAILTPGGTETWAVNLTAGTKQVICDVPFHVDRGMTTSLNVS
jgi:uncharacterized cupredoxin-like copper-binding protein